MRKIATIFFLTLFFTAQAFIPVSDSALLIHQGSILNAGNNMVLAAKESVHVTSGNINAGGTAVVASNDVTFDAAVDTHVTENYSSTSTVKGLGASLGKDEVTLGGVQKTKQTDTERTTTTTYQGTKINVGNLVVQAENDATFIASQVNVEGDAIVQAGNDLTIEGRADSTTTETYSKTDTSTVTAGVKNAYVDTALAADALVKAGEDVKRAERALRDAEKRVKNGTLAASALDDYKINLAAASTQLSQATLNLAASGATAAASTTTAGFYASGKAEKTSTEQHSTNTTQSYQGSNFNVGGNASFEAGNLLNIVGSGVTVQDTLTLNADHVNIRAGEEHSSSASSERTKSTGGSFSTGAGGSVSATASQSKNDSESHTLTHANSQISAGNLNSDSKSFTLAGANVEIQNDINLNTQHLTVESVQDTHQSSSKGSSQSVGVTAGGGSINPSSVGAGQNSSNEDSQWVNNQTTLIGGGKVNITADKTTVTGGIIANTTRNNDGSLTDHGNMNLVTDELIINDLQDHNRSDSKGIDLSAGLSKSGTSSVGLKKGGHNTEQTTFATLGGGTVTKKSGEQHDLTNTNRDLNNTQEITLDQQTGGLNATVTVDHRLVTEQGRAQIKEDFTKTGMIVDTVALIATTNRVGITDFFKETGKKHTTYEGIKSEIANNPDLAKQLQNPDLTPDQKEAMLDQLTHRVMVDLGYSKEGYQNIIVANDKDYVQKEDGIFQRQGFYSEETQNAYINDAFINDTKGLVTTAGHELSHAMDDRSDNTYSQKDNEAYANQFGNNFGNYTNVALGATGNGSMANSNSHVGNNSSTVQNQTQSYNALDKNKGDDLLFLAAPAVPVITAEAVTAVATLATAVGLKVFGDDIAKAIGVESKPTILETPAITASAEDSRIDGSQIVEQGATIYTTPEYTDNNNLYVNIPEGTDVNANSGGYQGEPISLDDLVMMAESSGNINSVRPVESPHYSNVYDVTLPLDSYPGVSRQRHNQLANESLHKAFVTDPIFAEKMERMYPGIIAGVRPGARGAYPRTSPTAELTWHHAPENGKLELIPIEHHTSAGAVQSTLHPNGKGGYSDWGTQK